MAEAISDLRMLLHHSKLTARQHSALDVAVLYFASKHNTLHIAAHLLLSGAGSCIPLTTQLNNELRLLVNTRGTIHDLICVLDDKLAIAGPVAAAVLRAVEKLSALAEPEVLRAVWSLKADLQLILAASCTGADAAAAAAVLAVSAAKRGQPARALLHNIFLQAKNSKDTTVSAVSSASSAQVWAEVAMTPMLQQLQQEICSWQGTACLTSIPQAPAAAHVQHVEVWLLLCSCINAAAAAVCSPLLPIEQLFSQPAVSSAIQAVLTSNGGGQGYQATVNLINQVSALSPALARCCFEAVAPVIVQLLQQQQSTNSRASRAGDQSPNGRAAAVAAAGSMWHRLLLRMRGSFSGDIEEFMSYHLPLVAAGLAERWNTPLKTATAAAYPTVARGALVEVASSYNNSSGCARSARITAFVAAAKCITPCTKALLQRHPAVVIAAVQPHIDALAQVIRLTATAAALGPEARQQQQQVQDQAQLLAFWLLHSLIAALQQQRQPCLQQGAWSGIIEVVTDLMSVNYSAADVQMQSTGLQLARDLLKWQQTPASDTPQASVAQPEAPPPPAVAVAIPEPVVMLQWHRLLTALVGVFRQCRVTPRELNKRHLLLVACRLLADLADWLPQQYTTMQQQGPAAATTTANTLFKYTVHGVTASTAGIHGDIRSIAGLVKESCTHLRALRQDLSRQRLERSSSSQDLVDAIDGVLSMLGPAHQDAHLMYRSSASSSVCLQLRMLQLV